MSRTAVVVRSTFFQVHHKRMQAWILKAAGIAFDPAKGLSPPGVSLVAVGWWGDQKKWGADVTTKAFQLRGMMAGDIRMAMWQDPANAGLPKSVLRAKFEAAVKEATKGLPGLPHAYLQKVAASYRAARQKRRREMNLVPYGSSQRQRRRLVAARVRWQLKNG